MKIPYLGIIKSKAKKIMLSYRKLPDKKPYIEIIAAIISVPFFISMFIVNLNSLKSDKEPSPSPTPEVKNEEKLVPTSSMQQNNSGGTLQISLTPIITETSQPTTSQTNTNTSNSNTNNTNTACKAEVGPVSISSPSEGDTVTSNPVVITISYKTGEYCAAVWSYSINGGAWSTYDDTSIALYNVPDGKTKVDVRVKSIVNGDVKTLSRSFTYKSGNNSAATPTVSTDVKGSSTSAN